MDDTRLDELRPPTLQPSASPMICPSVSQQEAYLRSAAPFLSKCMSPVAESSHMRRVVGANAPALFVLPCGDPACREGGHEITDLVMRPLRAHDERFEGQHACNGQTGTAPCTPVLHFVAVATYAKD